MKNLEQLTEAQKKWNYPGYELGEFLLDYSASPAHIRAMLEMYLAAVELDLKESRDGAACPDRSQS